MSVMLDLGNLLIHLRGDASQFHKVMNRAENRIKASGAKFKQLGTTLTLGVTVPLLAMGTVAVKAFGKFDDAMTHSLAIMGDVSASMRDEMEKTAIQLSLNTTTSAKGLADAYFFLASAGLNAEQSMAALGAVNRFAIAGQFDMARATSLAADAQSALGLKSKDAQKNLKNLIRVTDVLTGANTLANATTEQFSLSLTREAGAVAAKFGIGLEETVSVLAAFASQGIKAERAGTLFSRMLRLMIKGFNTNESAWKKFNIQIRTADDELRPLADIIEDITKVTSQMGVTQRAATLDMLGFMARSQQAIIPLLGLSGAMREYERKLLGMGGITKEVSDKQMKSFNARMLMFKNRVMDAARVLGKELAPKVLELADFVQTLTDGFKNLDGGMRSSLVNFGIMAALLGPILFVIGKLITMLGSLGTLLASTAVVLKIVIGFLGLYGLAVLSAGAVLFDLARKQRIHKALLEETHDTVVFGARSVLEYTAAWAGLTEVIFASEEGFILISKRIRLLSLLQSATLELNQLQIRLGDMNWFERNFSDASAHTAVVARINSLREMIERFESGLTDVTEDALELSVALNDIGDAAEENLKVPTEFQKVIKEWETEVSNVGKSIGEVFVNAFNSMSDALATFVSEGKADFNSLAKSILHDILAIQIRAMIVLPIVQALGLGGVTPRAGNTDAGLGSVNVAHAGGVVGHLSRSRSVPTSVFNSAQRYHNGGVVGLKPREVPIIAKEGEVISPEGTATGGASPTVIINNQTGEKFEQQGQPTWNGEEWVVTVVAKNISQNGQLRSIIGGLGRNG